MSLGIEEKNFEIQSYVFTVLNDDFFLLNVYYIFLCFLDPGVTEYGH